MTEYRLSNGKSVRLLHPHSWMEPGAVVLTVVVDVGSEPSSATEASDHVPSFGSAIAVFMPAETFVRKNSGWR